MAAIISLLFMLVWLGFAAAIFAGLWKSFVKAGLPGWAGIIPIYNMYLMWQMTNKPILNFIFLFIWPLSIITMIDVAKAYGKGTGMGVALSLGVGWPFLGFGDATYQGKKIDMNVTVPANS